MLGAGGILAAAAHYSDSWSSGGGTSVRVPIPLGPTGVTGITGLAGGGRPWVPPLVFAGAGFLLVALAFWVARRRRA